MKDEDKDDDDDNNKDDDDDYDDGGGGNNNNNNNKVVIRNSNFIKTKYIGTHKLEPQAKELKYIRLNRTFGCTTPTTSIFI
jgi:hypothetical protein